MKKLKYPFLKGLIFSAVFLMFSCDADREAGEVQPVKAKRIPEESAALKLPGLSFPIMLNRVDLFLDASTSVSGTVTVQIRNADGSSIIGSTTVSGSSLIKGTNKKNTFWLPNLTLNSGEKYRIYLIRSNTHSYPNNAIFWKTCSGGVDGYPKGVMNYSPAWLLDYAFVTYSDGYVDQQQLSTNYGFAVGNNDYLWQEFVPSKIWVIGQ